MKKNEKEKEIMREPLTIDQFMDLIVIMKDSETIIDSFSIF